MLYPVVGSLYWSQLACLGGLVVAVFRRCLLLVLCVSKHTGVCGHIKVRQRLTRSCGDFTSHGAGAAPSRRQGLGAQVERSWTEPACCVHDFWGGRGQLLLLLPEGILAAAGRRQRNIDMRGSRGEVSPFQCLVACGLF